MPARPRLALSLALLAASFAAAPSAAAEPVKIGFVTTLSGPNAAYGADMRRGVELAIAHLGGIAGGRTLEVLFEDDGQKPELGKRVTDKLLRADRVDFLGGYIWSNVLMAALPGALRAETFVIGANAGPWQIAGDRCSPYFFSTSWQNDQPAEAMGLELNALGVESLWIMMPNYAAGRAMATSIKRTFAGEIVGESYTKWPDQIDFSAELARIRAAAPDGLFVFYPGRHSVQIFNQFTQAGLDADVPLYHVFTVDALSLPAQGAAALGSSSALQWAPNLDNPANRRFVADFVAAHGTEPSFYAAQSYDAIQLIASAVTATGGDLSDKEAIRAALRAADFDSVRGAFRFNQNHFPIQSFHMVEVAEGGPKGLTTRAVRTIADAAADVHQPDCGMRW